MNLVKLNTMGIEIDVDIDRAWDDFLSSDFEYQLELVSSSDFWITQIFGVNLPHKTKTEFWRAFQNPKAERARDVAIHGLKWANNFDLFMMLKDAIDTHKDRDDGKLADRPEDALMHFALIGMQFSEIAAKRDHKIFRRMADMIQDGGIPSGKRGSEDELNAEVMREFALHFRNTRSLPTKKQLREAVGFSSEKEDAERFRNSIKQLGLSGLPQSTKGDCPG